MAKKKEEDMQVLEDLDLKPSMLLAFESAFTELRPLTLKLSELKKRKEALTIATVDLFHTALIDGTIEYEGDKFSLVAGTSMTVNRDLLLANGVSEETINRCTKVVDYEFIRVILEKKKNGVAVTTQEVRSVEKAVTA